MNAPELSISDSGVRPKIVRGFKAILPYILPMTKRRDPEPPVIDRSTFAWRTFLTSITSLIAALTIYITQLIQSKLSQDNVQPTLDRIESHLRQIDLRITDNEDQMTRTEKKVSTFIDGFKGGKQVDR